jgi:hypothetical protein
MASGFYGLTLEKIFKKTQTGDLESETAVQCMMVRSTYTPAYDTHDFRADVTSEVTAGSGYTSGGQALTTTELTVASPAATQINYDSDNPSWATSTITSAAAAIHFFTTGSAATDQLIFKSDFSSPATSSNGTFTITVDTNGWWYWDYA